MKKSIVLFLFIFFCSFCFSQKKATLTIDSATVVYTVVEDSLNIIETIELENLSSSTDIYLPKIESRDNYYFILSNTLYSNFGVMSSRLGYPSLSLDLNLIKIAPKQKYSYSVTFLRKPSEVIDEYFFSFDFIRGYNLPKRKRGLIQDGIIKMIDYATMHKYGTLRLQEW